MQELKAYYSFTHTLDYRVARSGNRIVWIDSTEGHRQLLSTDLPGRPAAVVTESDGDDGQPIHITDLSPSGRYLLYRRGGRATSIQSSHPRQEVFPQQETVLLADLESAGKHLLTSVSESSVILPDDSAICHTTNGAVWLHLLDSNSDQPLLQTKGRVHSLAWSDDSCKLAFISQLDKRAMLGIYIRGQKTFSWVSPGFDRDASPAWSPDGRYLAFLRFQGPELDCADQLFTEKAASYAILVFDAEDGDIVTAWDSSSDEQAGLSRQHGERPLIWRDNHHLLFSHDSTGWNHIYQFNVLTHERTCLTQGDWLVTSYATDNTGERIILSSNHTQRHQYSIRLLTGQNSDPNLQLPDKLQCWRPKFCYNNRYVVFLGSSLEQPCQLHWFDRDTQITGIFSEARAAKIPHQLTYQNPKVCKLRSLDDAPFTGFLYLPESSVPCPAVISLHGGIGQQTLPGFHEQLSMSCQYCFCQLLVKLGFVVLDINVRGSGGYGKQFLQAPERGWDGASDYCDLLAAGRWLAQHARVERSRIGVIGEAWGATLAATALARDSGLFRAGVVVNGCSSYPRQLRKGPWHSEQFHCIDGESATEHIARAKIAEESSPWGALEHWMSPVLLIHSGDNWEFDFAESQHLAHELRSRSVTVESLILTDESHDLRLHDSRLRSSRKALGFLLRHLVTDGP